MLFLNDKGILGLNSRNLEYIRPYNRKKTIKLADNKIKTKKFLSARGIPVPKLYGTIKNKQELDKFDFNSLPNAIVLKPNYGFGGEGIIPISAKRGDKWITSSSKKLTKGDLVDHISDILDGRYSISNVGSVSTLIPLVRIQFLITDLIALVICFVSSLSSAITRTFSSFTRKGLYLISCPVDGNSSS